MFISTTLEMLYSSFGLENDFCGYLSQATSCFSPQEIDEIHVKSDISYKGGNIYGPNLTPEDLTKTVFAIMVSSLHKMVLYILFATMWIYLCGNFFHIIKSCIIDIEHCGLRDQVISTDNYPLKC